MPVATMQREEVVSAQESLIAVRNMMRMAVSTIAYLRNVFPDESFTDKNLSGVNLKSLVPNCAEVRMVIDWLEKGVFDALQKQYLRVLSMVILSSEGDNILENYDFHIDYPEGGTEIVLSGNTQPHPQSREGIARSMKHTLRTLITLTQSMAELPPDRIVTMKIVYDPSTPTDYEPPFFTAASDGERAQFTSSPDAKTITLNMGSIASQYHAVCLKACTPQQFLDTMPSQAEVKVKEEVEMSEETPAPTAEQVLEGLASATPADKLHLKAVVYVFGRKDTVTLRRLCRMLAVSEREGKKCMARLVEWGVLSSEGKASSGEEVINLVNKVMTTEVGECVDKQHKARLEALLCGDSYPSQPTQSQSCSQSQSQSQSQALKKRALESAAPHPCFWYGDEPKISAIEKPLKQLKH